MTIPDRARRLLAGKPPAITGSGGRPATFSVAVILKKGYNMTDQEALPIFLEWNSRCSPPWTERELLAFLRDADKANKPSGYLLNTPSAAPQDEAEIRRRKRHCWPAMRLRRMPAAAALRTLHFEPRA